MARRKRTYEDKKIYIAFYISKTDLERIEKILQSGNSIFEDRSTIIRYCIKNALPKIEEEIFKTE